METLASTPANADNTAQVETAQADANADKTNGDGSAPSVPEVDTPETKRDKVQERFDKLTREKYEGLSRAERAEYRAQLAEQRLADLESQQTAKTEPVAPEQFPTLEQFGFDESKYSAAVAAHYSKLATEQGTKAAQEALRAERERQEAETAHKTWSQRQAEFKKSKPDYDAVALKDPREGGPTITPSMAQIIRASDVGPQVAYYLGENVDKANAIAQLHPIDQAREIGRIEAKIEASKVLAPPAVSKAPPPPSKVDVDEAPLTVKVDSAESDNLSDKEWTRRRNAQEQAKLRKIRNG